MIKTSSAQALNEMENLLSSSDISVILSHVILFSFSVPAYEMVWCMGMGGTVQTLLTHRTDMFKL